MVKFVLVLLQLGVEVHYRLGRLPDEPGTLVGELQTFEEQGGV